MSLVACRLIYLLSAPAPVPNHHSITEETGCVKIEEGRRRDVPGLPDHTEKEGTTVPSGRTVLGRMTARSLMITNLP